MNKIIIFFALTLVCASCYEERIELDLNSDNKRLVVNAWISNLDESQYVNLSYTRNYLGNPTVEYIDGAEVKLNTLNNEYILNNEGNGNYRLEANWIAEIGLTYTLEIIHEGVTYTATEKMRPCPEIENAQVEEFTFKDIDTIDLYETVFEFQELPGKGDGYYLIDYEKNSLDGDTLYNGAYATDQFFDGEYIDDVRLSEEDRLFKLGDTFIIELYSIGDEAANYFSDIESEVFRGGPFDPPPANVRTNISNGALGYFIIADTRSIELIVK